MCFFCPDTPPEKVSAKGSRGNGQRAMLEMQNQPHQFAVGLKDVCCIEPCCCIGSCIGTPYGCNACYARKSVLERYHNGMDDYKCCQGYFPFCGMSEQCKGSPAGLFCEGCCCPIFSVSIARIHLMHKKRIRPDPCDYQLIACSNCLQLVSCIIDIIAIFNDDLRALANLIDLLADLVTCSIAGCMGAQIYHEIKKDKDEIQFVVVQGVVVEQPQNPSQNPNQSMIASQDNQAPVYNQYGAPVATPGATPVAYPVGTPVAGHSYPAMEPTKVGTPAGAPPQAEEMER